MINCIHHRSGLGSRLCDSSLAAVMPTASARAKAKAKAKALLHKTTPRKRRVQLRQANDRQEARREAVRLLRELATQLGVNQVKVPTKRLLASEPKVERLIRALQGRCVTVELQYQLRHAVQQWSDHGGVLSQPILPPTAAGTPPTQQTAETETPRAVVAADDDDDDVSPLPQHKILTPGFILKSSAFMMTFNSTTIGLDAFEAFVKWIKQKKRQLGARAWTACIEVSENAAGSEAAVRYHLHAYLFWTDGVGVYMRNLDALQFQTIVPRVDKCTSQRKVSPRVAAWHGLWYVSVMKRGTMQSDGNFHPWVHYKPRRVWVETLYEEGKLSHQQYHDLSMHFPAGYISHKRDSEELQRDEHEMAVKALVAKEMDALVTHGVFQPPRSFPEVTQFLSFFDETARPRRPVLAIVGGTRTGKSLLAARVLQQLADKMHLPSFLEITVEQDTSLDLSEFRVTQHSGVLLDGVGDVKTLKAHREVLQGRPKVTKGGRSATMMYSYPYTLCRRAVIATLDLSAANLKLFRTDHWLSNPENVIVLRLTQPAWGHGSDGQAPQRTAAETMARWTVADVVHFLEEADLDGPAEFCRQSGVAGADLLQLTAAELIAEVRLSPFAARKVSSVRDAYLNDL